MNVAGSYDTIAVAYAEKFRTELVGLPLDRALLAAFVERAGSGPILEVGSGPGKVTAHLRGLGADVSGVDLSPEMVRLARTTHPELSFEVGSMTRLDRPDGSLAGLVAFYSIIHTPTDGLPALFAEFRRVLTPGGHLLLAFQTGDTVVTRTEAFGCEIALDYYLRPVSLVADALRDAEFSVYATADRIPEPDERIPRGYILATKL